ncbi:MAG TPA: Ig-like domain repeat protein [Candidatus Dormibacteraeota bacterium]|nr:Ig-like domain repeat protein [Candidatus Dormibacteraeota bacterium]
MAIAATALIAAAIFTGAQTNLVPSGITQAIDAAHLTILQGNVNPLAQARFDRGAAPSSLPMQRMLLVLKRSGQQEDALDTLLQQQQDASSPNYHHWLTPQQFGQQFGPSNQDIQTIASWLESQGFQLDRVSNGRTVIEFSGTAGEVQSAFHTSIDQYLVNGENHWANASDPAIPAALTPVVAGIDTLYNFPRTPLYHLAVNPRGPIGIGGMKPGSSEYTFPNPCSATSSPFCNFALGPYDFATIYNVLPLWNQTPSIDGTGKTIAIMGESDISISDIESFQKFFGMPVKDPTIIMDGPDPGTVPGDETESDLDVEWAGAIAKGANIDLVVSESTEASLGVDLSAQYAVDNNLAPVLSESYGVCEFFLGSTANTFYTQLWQQAAAQGITVVVSSGDAGSATCDGNLGSQGPAQMGLSVNGIASTPYNVAMGGTDFNDLTNPTSYWNMTNTTPSGSSGGVASLSAKGYIPEMTWNDTCTNQEIFSQLGTSSAAQTCNDPNILQNPNLSFLLDLAGGGGGKSACTVSDGQILSSCATPHTKPSWQTTLTPADSVRDLPDLAMFASNGFNGSFYIVCEADLLNTNSIISVGGGYASTSCDPNDQYTGVVGLGGTSAPTPAFAGIMAMVDQATNSWQGNANYALYKMAGTNGYTCTSAVNPAGTCVFYDIPAGSTISMPCLGGSPNCTTTNGYQYGVLYNGSSPGYNTSTGYDLATGLGSVNAANLVTKWKSFVLALDPSTTTLTLNSDNPVSITHGQSVPLSIAVAPGTGGSGTPSGNVSLMANTGSNGQQGIQSFALTSGATSGSTNALPGGAYTVFASYPGDGIFASSSSSPPVSVTVAKEASKIQFVYELVDPTTGTITNPNATSAAFGTPSLLRVNVTSAAGDACANNAPGSTGCPTGNIGLTDSYNGGTAAALDGGTFALNPQGYAEDQAVDLAGGTHVLAANYGGDSGYNAPVTNPATQTLTITPATTQTAIPYPSGISVTLGSSVNLDANVSAQNIYSAHSPTGTMTFLVGNTPVGTATVSGTVSSSTRVASASGGTSTTSLPHGQDNIVAQYSGDGSYAASVSSAYLVNVLWATNTNLTTSNSSIHYGSPVTFTATVTSSQGGSPAITGTISFAANGVSLGSATLSGGSAQLTTSAVAGGTQNIFATYSGDTNYSSGGASVTETVAQNSTTAAVTSSTSTATQGQSVTLTANITASASGPMGPTGNVEFLVNGNNFASAYATNGQAQITTTTLPLGTLQVSASYGGDQNYTGSSSSSVTVTVNAAPTFTVTANPTTIPITAPGQSGSTTLTFTGENGFSSDGNATISATCSGLPAYSSCSVNPSSVNIATNGTGTTTLTVVTTAASTALPGSQDRWDIGGWNGFNPETLAALAVLLLLCGGIAFGFRGRQRRWGLTFALAALALVFASAGCGGGGGGGSNPGTPVGSANFTVSITINGVTQTAPVTVNVQ